MILKKIFGCFRNKTQLKATPLQSPPLQPISWNEIVKECYDKNLEYIYPVVKVIYTDDKTERAVILKKPDTLYTIVFSKLYPYYEDELQYISSGLHGYWGLTTSSGNSIFDTEKDAINAVFLEPPFKYNKSVIWADYDFRIDAENLCWIKNDDVDDPDDFCLHGQAHAKIGDVFFQCEATVSATGLYLLRSLTENHSIHEHEHILPCCGHWMLANDDLSSVDIGGCSNGVNWSVIHENDIIKFVTESGTETLIDIDNYRQEVYAFTDKIEAFYKKSSPKNLLETDSISRDGYAAFWNEWHRRRL